MVFEYIQTSWEAYKENALSLILAELILFLIVSGIAGIGILYSFSSLGISSFFQFSSLFTIEKIAQILPLFFSFSFIFFSFLVALLIDAFLKTGIYGMADEALRGGTEVESMFETAREKGLSGLAASIIIGIIGFIIFFILAGGLGFIFSVPGFFVGLILSFLLMIFFSLTYPAIVVDDLSATEAIKGSFKTVKENYSQALGLLFFYFLLTLSFFIPFIGIFLFSFLVLPMFRISLILFYKRNRYL